jgi:hypothetical protein
MRTTLDVIAFIWVWFAWDIGMAINRQSRLVFWTGLAFWCSPVIAYGVWRLFFDMKIHERFL